MIGFNKPYLTGKELDYIKDAVQSKHLAGNGKYTKKCQEYFQQSYSFSKCLLTTSCTDALEMAAILLNINSEDEVIVPSFTFVSTANAFVLRGAKIVFADSRSDHPNIDESKLEGLITKNTKAIVVVHYAGVACDMDYIMALAKKHNIYIIEDAAQAIDSYYNGKPLGGIGHLAAFSFHETKNIISGEGGLLVVNDKELATRAEIIWEKGTNRAAFFRGEVNKYGWVDIGSSFLPSELIAAFLFAQLENLETIQTKRKFIWEKYYKGLSILEKNGLLKLPSVPLYATNNAHMFYLICDSLEERTALIAHLKEQQVHAVFHYLSLHSSPYFIDKYEGNELKNSDMYSNQLLRLPMFYELSNEQTAKVIEEVIRFYEK